ncbi:MAG: hypothetical protein ACLSUW_04700 [Akkermansia sp.]
MENSTTITSAVSGAGAVQKAPCPRGIRHSVIALHAHGFIRVLK